MSQENVDAFMAAIDANNRRDFEGLLEFLDPEIEWHPATQALIGGESAVYRGYAGVRAMFRDFADVFIHFHIEISEIRDLGEDRLVATGLLHARGSESGAEAHSPLGFFVEGRNGKAVLIRTYFDPEEALEAAGLRQ